MSRRIGNFVAVKEYRSNITPDEIKELPVVGFEGRIEIVDTPEKLLKACEHLMSCRVIGFDTETRPSFKAGVSYNVSLVQLSTDEVCYLVRLCSVRMERPLLRLLESKEVLKVGVDVVGDVRNLNKLRHFRAGGFVELQKEVEAFGIEDKSLRKMAAIILGVGVSKAQRLSNWEAKEMTTAQMRYAATDAWVCLKMFRALFPDGHFTPHTPVALMDAPTAEADATSAPAAKHRRHRPHRGGRKRTKTTQSPQGE